MPETIVVEKVVALLVVLLFCIGVSLAVGDARIIRAANGPFYCKKGHWENHYEARQQVWIQTGDNLLPYETGCDCWLQVWVCDCRIGACK